MADIPAEAKTLLCTISDDEVDLERKPLERLSCSYAPTSMRFRLKEHKLTQYAQLYYCRLNLMRIFVEKEARKKWDGMSICKLNDLQPEQDICIVGTLFKEMSLKPSILKEISGDYKMVPFPLKKRKYTSPSDRLLLEDELQRIVLTGNIPMGNLITGIVMAVRGHEMADGQFLVKDYCFAGCPPLTKPLTSVDYTTQEDSYIALVSGLNLGSDRCARLSVQMLVDYLSGHLGGPEDRACVRNIVRVVVAGNSITDEPTKSSVQEERKKKYSVKNYAAHSMAAVQELDTVLAQLASCVPVDIMPGSHDPVNFTLPQQPFKKCIFPLAAKCRALRGVTNPFQDEINGRAVLGCSGQNVDDIFRFSKQNDRMDILESTLRWRHIAPTAPDTLGCYPFSDNDPFVLEESPHIYFAGNQPSFQSKTVKIGEEEEALLVLVPSFDVTHSCVLVNLKTLQCKELKIHDGESIEHTDQGGEAEDDRDEDTAEPVGEETFNIMDNDDDDDDM